MPPLEEGSGNLEECRWGGHGWPGAAGLPVALSPGWLSHGARVGDTTHALLRPPSSGRGRGSREVARGFRAGCFPRELRGKGALTIPRATKRPLGRLLSGGRLVSGGWAPRPAGHRSGPVGTPVQAGHCPEGHPGAGAGLGPDDHSGKLPGSRSAERRGNGAERQGRAEPRRQREGGREQGGAFALTAEAPGPAGAAGLLRQCSGLFFLTPDLST